MADRFEEAWNARRAATPISAVMRFSEAGLTFGAATVLAARAGEGDGAPITLDASRLSALLAAAHLRTPPREALAHVQKAANCWRRGEQGLADMLLALSA